MLSGVSEARSHKVHFIVSAQWGESGASCALPCLQVFEQSPTFATAGALLGFAINSQKALAAIDPTLMQQVEAVAVSPGKTLAFNHTGVHAAQTEMSVLVSPNSLLPAATAAAVVALPQLRAH